MGSIIELNDTLQITSEQGFPEELTLDKHLEKPISAEDLEGRIFSFKNKEGHRIYQIPPSRCFLVHNIKGKWLYWGEIEILTQTINSQTKTTSGTYKITKIYPPDYQKEKTKRETPIGKSYF